MSMPNMALLNLNVIVADDYETVENGLGASILERHILTTVWPYSGSCTH